MEYLKHIKSKIPFYLSSGVICAILIFLLIVLNSYKVHLETNLIDLRKILTNKAKIARHIKEIDAVTIYIKNEFDLDADNINADLRIFNALDEMKNKFTGSTINVVSSNSSDNENIKQVDIAIPIKDYPGLVQTFRYLESFRIPKYNIDKFTIRKGMPGEMILNVYGAFEMASLRE